MKYLRNNWLIIVIAMLPLLDILNYFFISSKINIILTVARFLIMPMTFLIALFKSDNKKKFIIFLFIVMLYILGHCISCYISGYINIKEDIENMFRVLYMPTLLFSFNNLLTTNNDEQSVRYGMSFAFAMIILSLVISFLVGNVVYTYDQNIGINGWFYNKNTQSLIVVMLSYICAMYSLKGNTYYPLILLISFYLFFNGTKTSYIALIILLFILTFYCVFEIKNVKKTLFTLCILVASLGLFNYTPMIRKLNIYNYVQTEKNVAKKELIDIIDTEEKEFIKPQEVDKVKKNKLQAYILLYRDYDLSELIDKFGIKKVLEKYSYSTDAFDLSNVRKKKKIAASLIYDEESTLSHFFGFEFTKIKYLESDESLDLETDFSAIFYYTGYIGFALYLSFICYYILNIFKSFIKNPSLMLKGEYTVWIILAGLMLSTTELTGALLRRPNASIYFAILIAISYNKMKSINKDKDNKITFLNLHLGFGGIETATINTVNALSKKYKVEIISFYKLQNNQAALINKAVSIKYLYNGEPNREKVVESIKKFKMFSIVKEGIIAMKILFLKKHLIIREIRNSNSKYIVSTRYDFSRLLSAYKPYGSIAIAQEHHHHNNNQKYIKILKNEYKNIDYLFALTESLKNDYEKFLSNNKHTKIVTVPNMIDIHKMNIKKELNGTIISVGRLAKGKCVDELVDISKKLNDVKSFLIVGDGEEYNNLKIKINSDKESNNKIKLLGYCKKEKIEDYYLQASVFVMASKTEGLPMVLLEAMSYGLPCIAYKTESGVSDIIDDGINGYVIESRNQEDFAAKLKHLITSPKLFEKMSSEALKKAEKFSADNIVKKWEEILMENNSNKWMTDLFDKSYKSTKDRFVKLLKTSLKNGERTFVVTANPEAFMIARDDLEYRKLLMDKNTTIVADGIGLIKAGNILDYKFEERIPGVEISEELLKECNKLKKKVFLFGAKEEVIAKLKEVIKSKYPNIKIVGALNGYIVDKDSVFTDIKKSNSDLILVALGMPLQEKLIYKHLNEFNKGIFIGVGGTFDVLSGTKTRAPKIFIKCNLEWLYRLIKEPKRIKRFYNNNVKFLFYIKKMKK